MSASYLFRCDVGTEYGTCTAMNLVSAVVAAAGTNWHPTIEQAAGIPRAQGWRVNTDTGDAVCPFHAGKGH